MQIQRSEHLIEQANLIAYAFVAVEEEMKILSPRKLAKFLQGCCTMPVSHDGRDGIPSQESNMSEMGLWKDRENSKSGRCQVQREIGC